jgi:hypothetical protein
MFFVLSLDKMVKTDFEVVSVFPSVFQCCEDTNTLSVFVIVVYYETIERIVRRCAVVGTKPPFVLCSFIYLFFYYYLIMNRLFAQLLCMFYFVFPLIFFFRQNGGRKRVGCAFCAAGQGWANKKD